MDESGAVAYLISFRRDLDGPLEHLAVRGTWDEVERLVQDIASHFWQAGFVPLEDLSVARFRRLHPDLFDREPV